MKKYNKLITNCDSSNEIRFTYSKLTSWEFISQERPPPHHQTIYIVKYCRDFIIKQVKTSSGDE